MIWGILAALVVVTLLFVSIVFSLMKTASRVDELF